VASNTVRVLIVFVIGGGIVYGFLSGGGTYVITFIIALLAWTLREAVWHRGSGYRGRFIKYTWGLDNDWKIRRNKNREDT
jgi:hypothetical protein